MEIMLVRRKLRIHDEVLADAVGLVHPLHLEVMDLSLQPSTVILTMVGEINIPARSDDGLY